MADRFDFHFQLIDPAIQQTGPSNFTFGFGRAIAVRGIQKLVNRWVKMFFTPVGTDPLHRKYGSGFPYLIGGNVANVKEIEENIQLHIDETNDLIQSIDRISPELTSDEKLASVTMIRFNILRADAVEFWVTIRSSSGVQARVLIPYASS